jgi:hypothetical protein
MAIENNVVVGAGTDGYISADAMLKYREILKQVADGYDEQDFISFLELTGRAEGSANTTFSHYEKGWIKRPIKIAAVIPTGTAAKVTFTIDATSHTTTGGKNSSPGKKTDVIRFANGVFGYVVAKSTASANAHTLTVVRRDGTTDDVLAAAVQGSSVAVFTNAHAEGSGQPEGQISLDTRFEGRMQHFKKHAEWTGDMASNKLVVEHNGKPYHLYKQEADQVIEHRLDMGFQFILGPSGYFTDNDGNLVPLTDSLDSVTRSRGSEDPYTIGALAMSDIDAWVRMTVANRGGKEQLFWVGNDLKMQVGDLIDSKVPNGGVQYNAFSGTGKGKEQSIKFGYDSFERGGVTFHMRVNEAFAHPKVTALDYPSANSVIPNSGFIMPAGTQKVVTSEGTKNIPSIIIKYAIHGKEGSRRYMTWNNGRETNGGFDKGSVDIHSQEGLQFTMAHKFIKIVGQ